MGNGTRATALIAGGLPDPMVVTPFDGDIALQRAAHRQILLITEQRKTNELLQALVDLQRASLDAGRVR